MHDLLLKADTIDRIIKKVEAEVVKARIMANEVAQYSRLNNIRIYGLKIHPNETCKEAVCDFINYKWGSKINPAHIATAYTLPIPPSCKRTVRSIIVRFHNRALRDTILKNSKVFWSQL